MYRAALALIVLAPATAGAAIFERDDRVTAPPASEFTAIGFVTGGANVYYGSGFLIDACTVMSARHVAGAIEHVMGRRLAFRSGRWSSDGEVIAAGPFSRGPQATREISADWMLIRLNHCIGRKIGFLRLATAEMAFAGKHEFKIEDAGFPRDRPITSGLTIDPDCRLLWVGGGRIAHDCATLAGNSGGPLLARDGAGWVAIGINVAGADRSDVAPFRPSEPNLAIDLEKILPQIYSVISKERTLP